MAHKHGGDTEGYLREYGCIPLDFSANVSPLGLPEGVRAAACKALDSADAYPDPLCRSLSEEIAAKEQKTPEQVICGNGAADLIFRLALAIKPRKALLPAPTFAEYEQALELEGCETEHFFLSEDKGFLITRGLCEKISPRHDLVFLCQPNNPTAQLCDRELLLGILNRCRDCGTTLVVDECFVDFLETPEDFSLSDFLEEYQNLFILKAFTKLYAMAGLRLGYGLCANGELLQKMRAAGQPWSVSSIAQKAGIAALCETGYVQEVKALLRCERPYLSEGLSKLGMQLFGSAANYIFFKSPDDQLHLKLRKKGILIRDCSNYVGLNKGYYRIAIRTREENEVLLAAVKEAFKGE